MELNTPNIEYISLKIAGKDILLSSSCRASFKSPFNKIDVRLKPKNTAVSYYEVRVTKADEESDIGVGTLVSWSANLPVNEDYQFSIDINEKNFKYSDGAYRISFYAKSATDGSWDVSYLFFTLDQVYFTLSDGNVFEVLTDRDSPTEN
jgi:hypothetical protein